MGSRRVPSIPTPSPDNLTPSVQAIATVVKHVTGQSQPALDPLPAGASLEDVRLKLNAILARLQGQ